jgi:hypothetical protein
MEFEFAARPVFLLYYHVHSLASLTARFCIEIAKQAHPNAKAKIIQIEVMLTENGRLPVNYLKTNATGTVSTDGRSYSECLGAKS